MSYFYGLRLTSLLVEGMFRYGHNNTYVSPDRRGAERGNPLSWTERIPENFASQMKWLARLGYRGLSLSEIAPYVRGRKTGKVFGLTFDDGFENVRRYALPQLDKFGFSATCFFVSGQIGDFNSWDRSTGIPYAACMSRNQVIDWAKAGNEIGAHTVDHLPLTEILPAEAFRQINESKLQLEELAGQEVRSFCYPYGAVSRDIRNMVAKAGFELATTTRRARAEVSDDPLLLPRRNVRHCNGFLSALRKVALG